MTPFVIPAQILCEHHNAYQLESKFKLYMYTCEYWNRNKNIKYQVLHVYCISNGPTVPIEVFHMKQEFDWQSLISGLDWTDQLSNFFRIWHACMCVCVCVCVCVVCVCCVCVCVHMHVCMYTSV